MEHNQGTDDRRQIDIFIDRQIDRDIERQIDRMLQKKKQDGDERQIRLLDTDQIA